MRSTEPSAFLFLKRLSLLSGLFLTLSGLSAQPENTKQIPFYTASIEFNGLPDLPRDQQPLRLAADVHQYLNRVPVADLQRLSRIFSNRRTTYRLNDWLHYKLISQVLAQAYPTLGPDQREVILFLLLAQAGYDSRLMIYPDRLETMFYVTDRVFNAFTLSFEDDSRSYLIPSTINSRNKPDRRGHYFPLAPNPNGRALQLRLQDWPRFQSRKTIRKLQFHYQNELFEEELLVPDAPAMRMILEEYPILESKQYWRTPLSPELNLQLDAWLKPQLKGKSKREAIQFLLAFCRQAFPYKTDDEAYGRERPFFAQELFFFPYSDCEDRVALFFQLVTHWLHLPIVVVDLPDHLTTAIAFPGGEGPYLEVEGRKFWFCDPTGPANPDGEVLLAPDYGSQNMSIIDQEFFRNN
jgi:hypothetical protein